MAIIKFGPIVTGARGSVGGTTFSRSRGGAFIRQRVKPVFSLTSARLSWAIAMSTVWDRWLNQATAAQRADWNTLGDNTNFTNALGDTYHPSGWNLYLRTNSLAVYWIHSYVNAAPGSATTAHFVPTFEWDDVAKQITVAAWPGGGQFSRYFCHFSPALRPTVYSYRAHFVYQAYLSTFAAWPDVAVTPANMYATGDRVFIRDRIRDTTGEVSAPYYTILDCEP